MRSLKSRLIGVATLWIAIGMLAAGFVLAAVFEHHVKEQFYSELFVHLDELHRLAEFPTAGNAHLQRHLSDPRYDVPLSGYYWEIAKSGKVLARSVSMQGAPLKTPVDSPTDVGVHTHEIEGPTGTLLVAEKAVWVLPNESPVRFLIGTDQRHLDSVLAGFNKTLAWSLTGFGLSMVAAATLLILYALHPFTQLRTALSRVRSGAVKRLEGYFPTEVVPLVEDLNALLASSAELIQRARTQAGNLAHGLKSPLAILTDEAYRLDEAGQSQSSATIMAQCRKMQLHIDYQIARARAAALRSSPGVVADARNGALKVASALDRLYGSKNIKIDVEVPAGVSIACDPQDLNEMLANVMDNACKNARSRVRVTIPAAGAVELTTLRVDDDGPGLPPEAFEVVFDVGERWDSRTPGSGLGLSIVRDLARLYGGDVRLEKSEFGGLAVLLSMPAVHADAS